MESCYMLSPLDGSPTSMMKNADSIMGKQINVLWSWASECGDWEMEDTNAIFYFAKEAT